MSRKHNTKHPLRSRSNYPRRLEARGLSHAPVMADPDYLRRHQGTEAWLTSHPIIVLNLKAYSLGISPHQLAERMKEAA